MKTHSSTEKRVNASSTDMPLYQQVTQAWGKLATFLTHAGRPAPEAEGCFVNLPVARGSTVVFPTVEDMQRQGRNSHAHSTVYGAMGNPVQHELEKVMGALEGGTHSQAVSSGLAACTVALLAFLGQGDHLLLPESVYGPTRRFAATLLARYGVKTDFYPPDASEEEMRVLIRPETRVVFAESPGSHTFEVQDVPMLARVSHENGARLLLDNTWGIGAFQPFVHGVDVSIQALTKYPGGHSDVILGAITVADEKAWKILRDTAIQLGECAGPDACWLVLRGLRTMSLRLEKQARTAYALALWLQERPEVARVRHPALPSCPGHAFWKRDFTGASGLFGVELRADIAPEAAERLVDSLALFGIGASWGGYESLVLPTNVTRHHESGLVGPAFRLQIGLEDFEDLRDDLEKGLARLSPENRDKSYDENHTKSEA